MNQRFIHATFIRREASTLYSIIPKEYDYFCNITCGFRSAGDFFLCKSPGTECHIAGQQEIKAFFFSQNSQKILFSLQNSLLIAKRAVFLRKIEGPSSFLHFRGVLQPSLYTQLAVCTEKLSLLRSFRTFGHLKTKICDVLMI